MEAFQGDRGLGFVTAMYMGEDEIGNVRVLPQPLRQSQSESRLEEESRSRGHLIRSTFGSGIRVGSLSPASQRCLPLMVLHTVSPDGVWLKLHALESDNITDNLRHLYNTCIEQGKTAVMEVEGGTRELHMVAVKVSGEGEECCFWGFVVPAGLYTKCLNMLNMRCLAMVLDLDETLLLANTMRSFEDRIQALRIQEDKLKIPLPNRAVDAKKLSNIEAEIKRYQNDRALLMQFIENDYIVDNGMPIGAKLEEVLVDGGSSVLRPVIRIPERNIILTRINPAVRDTSVLVRIRPAWEELRTYLIAKGRRRFEVFICTMSEKDYALEMWRLLDPGARLIEPKDLNKRLLCVKSGTKKSLSSMFHQLHCHPKMAMVIDDRPEVWEDKDQPHVHAVPAFSPYYAPHAEINAPVPFLCVARNVACNVRGGFFKDFDEVLVQKFSQITFNTDVATLPNTPYVGTYLTEVYPDENTFSENTNNISKVFPDGISGPEVFTALQPEKERSSESVNRENQQVLNAGGWLDADDEERPSCHHNGLENPEINSLEQSNGKLASPECTDKLVLTDLELEKIRSLEPIVALQELGENRKLAVEYRCAIRSSEAGQFSAEVYCNGNKAGEGRGKSNKEAKSRAAENALTCLTNGRYPRRSEDENIASTTDKKEDCRTPSFNSVAALRDMCAMEGLKVEYLERSSSRGSFVCEVEIDRKLLGKGTGDNPESAKRQAAEQALRQLSPGANVKAQKRYSPPPRSQQEYGNKRVRRADTWRPSRGKDRTPPRRYPYHRSRSLNYRR